jgi:hypothetical protein
MISIALAQQSLSLFLVLGLSSFLYAAIRRRRIAIWAQAIPSCRNDVQRWPGLFLSALHADKASGLPDSGSMHTPLNAGHLSGKSRFSMAGDWLAPVIVWFLVIGMGLAIASLLLGER